MSNDTASLKTLEPAVLIRLNDVMTGFRKLARVLETGRTSIEPNTNDCTALPVYATLEPKGSANILDRGLHQLDNKPGLHPAWKVQCDRLLNSGETNGVLSHA